MITTVASVRCYESPYAGDWNHLPDFPGLIGWDGTVSPADGLYVATISEELGDRLLKAEESGAGDIACSKLGAWSHCDEGWWLQLHTGSDAKGDLRMWSIGFSAEDIAMDRGDYDEQI